MIDFGLGFALGCLLSVFIQWALEKAEQEAREDERMRLKKERMRLKREE